MPAPSSLSPNRFEALSLPSESPINSVSDEVSSLVIHETVTHYTLQPALAPTPLLDSNGSVHDQPAALVTDTCPQLLDGLDQPSLNLRPSNSFSFSIGSRLSRHKPSTLLEIPQLRPYSLTSLNSRGPGLFRNYSAAKYATASALNHPQPIKSHSHPPPLSPSSPSLVSPQPLNPPFALLLALSVNLCPLLPACPLSWTHLC